MVVIREPQNFYFNFDWPKKVDENLKHEMKFIIKSNGVLAENRIKKEIEQLLSRCKHEYNINKHHINLFLTCQKI